MGFIIFQNVRGVTEVVRMVNWSVKVLKSWQPERLDCFGRLQVIGDKCSKPSCANSGGKSLGHSNSHCEATEAHNCDRTLGLGHRGGCLEQVSSWCPELARPHL